MIKGKPLKPHYSSRRARLFFGDVVGITLSYKMFRSERSESVQANPGNVQFCFGLSRAIPISADKTNDKLKVNTANRNSLHATGQALFCHFSKHVKHSRLVLVNRVSMSLARPLSVTSVNMSNILDWY